MVALFLLGLEVVEEIWMILSGTEITVFLFEVYFHREGGLWKMFGDEACKNASP